MSARYSLILFALYTCLLSAKATLYKSIEGENVPPEINKNHNIIGFKYNPY